MLFAQTCDKIFPVYIGKERGNPIARPTRCRSICREPEYNSFTPEGISSGGTVILSLDEYEVIRLIDLEKNTHEQCAQRMGISRTTVTEIYQAARYKVADGIVHGKSLRIAGGHYRLCDGTAPGCDHHGQGRSCGAYAGREKQRNG